jgi:adenylate kinase
LLVDLGGQIKVVPQIFVDEDILIQRLLQRAIVEGRADDNEETIRNRMKVYHEQTRPLLDYYRARGLLVEVDGDRPIEEVNADLQMIIEKE